ncbi:MAG TPA: IS21 family transposase [Bdellovibrionota bacterium]|nr:IS21 family transposase [Bdellovibrionota bacterium]
MTVFEELEGAGVRGVSRSGFYRFLDRYDLASLARAERAPSLIAPIIHQPGEALILDWGKLRDVIDPETKERRTLWAFVGVLGHSRYMMVRLVWTNDVPTTCAAIESMLQELGGVPRRITSDNPKCFSIKADRHDPILNPAFTRFAAHHGFVIECLPPREPKKKGKVERLIPFARRLFEAYTNDFVSLEHAQTYMDRKTGIANERKHGTTCEKPIEAYLGREAGALKPLPALCYEREEVAYPKVRRDGYARFANKYYALADEWIGREVVVVATAAQVALYGAGRLLEIYDRLAASSLQTHATKDHLKKPWQKLEEENQGYLAIARKIGANAEAFVRATLARGDGFVDTRIIWGLLSLDKKYPKPLIDQAAGIAMDMNTLSSRLVERLIKLTQSPENTANAAAPAQPPKFIRPMSVYKNHLGSAG